MWLSLVERLVWDQDAAGSNPVIRTIWLGGSYHIQVLALVVVFLLSYFFYPVITTRMKLKPQNKGFTINPSVLFTW